MDNDKPIRVYYTILKDKMSCALCRRGKCLQKVEVFKDSEVVTHGIEFEEQRNEGQDP